MNIYKTEDMQCPNCQKGLNRHTPAIPEEDYPPKEGDILICAYCACPLVFAQQDGKLGVRRATGQDLEDRREEINEAVWQLLQQKGFSA